MAAILWAGVGASFFVSNPAGVGSFIILFLPVAQSLLAVRAIHHKVERLEAQGGT